MIATAAEFTRERRSRAARRQWADPLARARLLAGQLVAAEHRRVDRLVTDHLQLLDRAAGYWHKRFASVPFEDLHSCAFPGLHRAAETWDPLHRSGASFTTFAFHWLNAMIRDALPNLLGGPIRVPKRATFPRPSFDDDAPEPEDESAACDPAEVASATEDRERVRSALGKLSYERDARAIRMLFGLDGQPPRTMADIGREFGVTGMRVRQLVDRGLAELREMLAVE